MKWVKVAIGAVIAISVIPLIVGVVGEVSKPKGFITIDFEIIDIINNDEIDFSPLTLYDLLFNMINQYGEEIDGSLYYRFTDNDLDDFELSYNDEYKKLVLGNTTNNWDITFKDNNPNILYTDISYGPISEGTYHIVTDIPKPSVLSPSLITLIALTPLIFVGGVMSYFLVKTNLKKED